MAQCQPVSISDSLGRLFQSKPKPTIKLDSRNSFITGTPVSISGVKAGVAFADRLELGIGYHWLRSSHRRLAYTEIETNSDLEWAFLKFRYVAIYGEYTFFSSGNWSITVPVQMGFGSNFLQYNSMSGERLKLRKGGVWLYEPAMLADYHFLRYFSLGGGIGYRLMLINNNRLDDRFTSPSYNLRFRVFFGKMWRDLKPE